MFQKILIANRGEIACRVIDTCRRLGVATVAVYSDADHAMRAMSPCPTRPCILGGPAPADSYLRGDAIIRAAQETGAQAIHPGYGFLSENPDFVDAVEAAGLVFVGPSAKAIRAMGLKDAAKKLMEEAGVPVVPGYHGSNQDADHLARQAEKIGYPVLIKAVAGGGGKGMRASTMPRISPTRCARAGRGEARLRQPARADREIFLQPAPYRSAGLRRWHPRRPSVRARLFPAAPPPEGDRGSPRPRHAGKCRASHGRGRGAAARDQLQGRGHHRIHRRRRGRAARGRVLFHGDEHPPSGRASGDRAHHRGRSLVEWQLRVASGEDLPARQGGSEHHRPCLRGAALCRGCPGGVPARDRNSGALQFPDHARISKPGCARRHDLALVRPDDREADRPMARPARLRCGRSKPR